MNRETFEENFKLASKTITPLFKNEIIKSNEQLGEKDKISYLYGRGSRAISSHF